MKNTVIVIVIILVAIVGFIVLNTKKAIAPTPPSSIVENLPENSTTYNDASKKALATSLGISVNDIKVVSSVKTDWPDACLGLADSDQICAQVITPGYKVTLSANSKTYIFHTNANGTLVMQE